MDCQSVCVCRGELLSEFRAEFVPVQELVLVSKLGGPELQSHVMPETAGYKTRLQLMCCALVWEPECLGIWRSGVVRKLLRDAEEV